MKIGSVMGVFFCRKCPPRRLLFLLCFPALLLLAAVAVLSTSFPFRPHGPKSMPSQPRSDALMDGEEDDNRHKTDPMPPHLRVVHLDMKGAPPKLSYLRALFPLIAAAGANALLIEYEDAFPYHGVLANASSEEAYTEEEIREILSEASRFGLEVIPLVQTFGHLEFALKLPEFKRLRELEAFPQEICPSNPDAFLLVQEIIRQVLALHSTVKWLHIGCDEVFHLAECTRCERMVRDTLRSGEVATGWAAWAAMDEKLYIFVEHVKRVARFVKEETSSRVSPIIWDDMLRRAPAGALRSSGLGDDLVEVMVWAYAEDASSLVPPRLWRAYSPFRHLWAAGAFKGAFREDANLPDLGRRVSATLSWTALLRRLGRARLLDEQTSLRGFVLTGWSRYDHFAVLCELLPPSVPSLLLNLLLLRSPPPGSSPALLQSTIDSWLRLLSCPEGTGRITPKAMYADENYWATAIEGCAFPGANALEATRRWPTLMAEASLAEDTAERVGWLTEWHAKRGFSSPWRVSKALQREVAMERELKRYRAETARILSQYVSRSAAEEWLQQKVDPVIQRVEKMVAWARELNGLGEFVEVFKKRNIDGDSLLSLTEGMLALWNREVSLPNIRKIGNFIEDIRSEPEKYCVPLRSKPTRRRSSKTYSQTSWNTVFESDYEYQNLNATGNSYPRHSLQETIPAATYQNQIEDKNPTNGDVANLPPFDIPIIPEKPPPPARPPSLKPRPKADYTAKLPVPPIPDEKQYEHLKTFISYIKLPSLEEKDLSNAVDSPVYESPDLYETSDSPSKDWGQNHESRRSPSYPSEERYSAEYESINETNSAEYYLHPSAVDTSVKPHLELSELQLRELPEAPAPPVKPKGLPSNASALLPPSTVPPPRPTESKPPSAENLDKDSFDAKSERIEYVLKKVISISHHPPGSVLKKEKVTASPEIKISTSSSTSSLTSVTTIKTNSGQAASLPDQRLPPNLRPLPPTPGTSSFRPSPATNAMPIPIRKTANSKVGITQYPWYHNVDRKRGEELVFNGEDGTFLVRPSTQTQNPYTLTIWFGKRVYNIGVRFRPDGKYALGTEKQNEQSFRSVEEMVSYYQSEQLVLYSGGERTGQTALKSSPKKE